MLIMSEQAFKKRNFGHKFCNISTALFRRNLQFCIRSGRSVLILKY